MPELELNAAVSRAVVRWHRDNTGRGPTKAQTFHRDDTIVVMLSDTLTKAEKRLVDRGHTEAVKRMRDAFEHAMRDHLIAEVEGLTGFAVRAFMTAHHIEPDMAVHVFVLTEPLAQPSSSSS